MQRISNNLFDTYKNMFMESNKASVDENKKIVNEGACSDLDTDRKEKQHKGLQSYQAKTKMNQVNNSKSSEKPKFRPKNMMKENNEFVKINLVVEDTYEIEVPSTIYYQDYLNAINTIVETDEEDIQSEIINIANEAFENKNVEVIAEAELIKRGIIESSYKASRMGHKEYSPELNMDIDKTEPGVTRVSRRIRSGEGKGITASERRTMKRVASRNK
jgi:hypothetical protein